MTNSRPQTCSCLTDQKVICLNERVSHVSPHLSNSNLKCQHMGKATAGATSYPCTLMQCDPCRAPQNKAPGRSPAAAAPLSLPVGRQRHRSKSPWCGWGPSALPESRERLCSCCASATGMGVPVAVSASLAGLTPFTSLLPFSCTVPRGAAAWFAAVGVCIALWRG